MKPRLLFVNKKIIPGREDLPGIKRI